MEQADEVRGRKEGSERGGFGEAGGRGDGRGRAGRGSVILSRAFLPARQRAEDCG